MKLHHPSLIFISGLIWLTVGLFLLPLGLSLVTGIVLDDPLTTSYPLLDKVASFFGGRDQAALVIIALGLLIGHFKGRYVLGKSANKGIERIKSFPSPMPLAKIYSPKYYILLGGMVLLGMSIKFFRLSPDIRGLVDIAIGAALINGALIYFRAARAAKVRSKESEASSL